MDAADSVGSKTLTIARGRKEWDEFLSRKRGYVRLDPDLREYFRSDEQINGLLRQVKQMMQSAAPKRRKSA